MNLTNEIAKLICEIEYLIGNECCNPNSYDGYTCELGCEYRYPVYIFNNELNTPTKYYGKVVCNVPNHIKTMKYKFGSNHLLIGKGLINVLTMLEERYDINFNELEIARKEYKLDL